MKTEEENMEMMMMKTEELNFMVTLLSNVISTQKMEGITPELLIMSKARKKIIDELERRLEKEKNINGV